MNPRVLAPHAIAGKFVQEASKLVGRVHTAELGVLWHVCICVSPNVRCMYVAAAAKLLSYSVFLAIKSTGSAPWKENGVPCFFCNPECWSKIKHRVRVAAAPPSLWGETPSSLRGWRNDEGWTCIESKARKHKHQVHNTPPGELITDKPMIRPKRTKILVHARERNNKRNTCWCGI